MREKMVTRDIAYSVINVLGVNSETGETENRSFTFGEILTDKKALNACIEANTDINFHPAVVVLNEIKHELRGMKLSTFLEHSEIIKRPPSQTKSLLMDGGEN